MKSKLIIVVPLEGILDTNYTIISAPRQGLDTNYSIISPYLPAVLNNK